jgi:predicted metal-dependent hydrolase
MKIHLPDVGEVEITKSSKAKRLILAVKVDGRIRLTVPRYVPYKVAEKYIQKNIDWIKQHAKPSPTLSFRQNQTIGKQHTLIMRRGQKLASRVRNNQIIIDIPDKAYPEDKEVQYEIVKACTRAIKKEAEAYLPRQLYALAKEYNYNFKEVRCKRLKTRWGSCSNLGIINLNIWLMQLPQELIDYVLIHELAHLNHPHHQLEFWQEVAQILPNYKLLRAELKKHQPYLNIT